MGGGTKSQRREREILHLRLDPEWRDEEDSVFLCSLPRGGFPIFEHHVSHVLGEPWTHLDRNNRVCPNEHIDTPVDHELLAWIQECGKICISNDCVCFTQFGKVLALCSFTAPCCSHNFLLHTLWIEERTNSGSQGLQFRGNGTGPVLPTVC